MRKITLLLSFVACAVFAQGQTTVASIAAMNAANSTLAFGATSTETFTITGEVIVTFVSVSSSGARTIYIQDATGASMIYDGATTKYFTSSPALYSGLTGVTGTVKSYNGILELIPNVAPAAATSIGNTPFAPIVTTLDQLLNYPMQLCTVNNVTISDQVTNGTGKFVASKSFPLSVGGIASTNVLRTAYADVNYIGTDVPTSTPQSITGLVLPYKSATSTLIANLIPRSSSDMTVGTSVSVTASNKMELKVVGNMLTISNALTSIVDIYNTVGAKVQTLKLVDGSAELNLVKGVYVARAGNQSAKIMIK